MLELSVVFERNHDVGNGKASNDVQISHVQVEIKWFGDYENMFETGVLRANECSS